MSNGFKSRWERLPKRLQVTYLLIIAVVTIGAASFLTLLFSGQISPKAATGQASISITSGSQNFNIGTVFPIYIQLGADQQDQISTIQINSLNYDPNLITVEGSTGSFQVYPSNLSNLELRDNTVNTDAFGNQTGKIDLTFAASGQNSYSGGSTRIATVNFRVLAAGQAVFSFDPYNASSGTGTYVSNITGNNILVSAPSGLILVGAAPESPSPQPSTVVPSPTTSESTSTNTTTNTTTNRRTTTRTTRKTPTPSPSVSSIAIISPEAPAILLSPPTESTIRVNGSFSTLTIIIYVAIALGLTIVIFLVWFFYNKKRPKKKLSPEDDDEII